MDRKRLWLLAAIAMCLVPARAGDAPVYTLAAPLQPGSVRYPQHTGYSPDNRWMNGAFVPSGGVATNVAVSAQDPDSMSQKRYSIVSSEAGFIWERNQPDYYLSDIITPPEDVDWTATKAVYDESYAESGGEESAFLLNPDKNNPCVYAVSGGTYRFQWIMKDGSTNAVSYTIGTTCRGRPRRIYWTDSPYNAPAVSMEGKFVRLLGDSDAIRIRRGTVTNDVNGTMMISTNTIVSGVYVDSSSQVMYAKGKPEGQFVLVYYDTGDYNNILCVEVIEAMRPEAVATTGIIGKALEPTGMGYEVDGLVAQVTAGIGDSDDERGDYLYQHSGEESYSPKNKDVFPLRPTVGMRWKAEIYWMETDPMGVQWPFELDQYENDWPAHGYLYVRGDIDGDVGAKVYIPSDYVAELCDYQEPGGHAVQVDGNNVFYTTGEGWSLLKLCADDNIWFLPIHSVYRGNSDYFTLEPHEVTVGQEFRIQGGTKSGIAFGAKELVSATDDAPGYIYAAASGTGYNTDLYYETTEASDPYATHTSVSTALPSVIYAVSESTDPIEVWWSRRVTTDLLHNETLPYWIDIPSLPQVFRPVWPEATEAPTIVIASQQGSSGESLFQQYGAATFDRPNGHLDLLSQQYFPNGTGALSFWTRPSMDTDPIDGVTNAPSALLQLGKDEENMLVLRIGHDEKLELLVRTNLVASVAMPGKDRPNYWTHIALTIENASSYNLYIDAVPVASGSLEDAGFLGETLYRCVAGRIVSKLEGLIVEDKKIVIPEAPTYVDDGSEFVNCADWNTLSSTLRGGKKAKLTGNIDQDTSTAYLGENVEAVLDLNGYEIKGRKGYWMFCPQKAGSSLAIIDSSSAKTGRLTFEKALGANGGGLCVDKGRLAVYGGTISGASTSGSCNGGCICVMNGALELNGGTITGCSSTNGNGGAVYICSGGSFTMNGGVIDGCLAKCGGAVCNDGGSFTMNGGTIRDCSATNRGGAIENLNGGRTRITYGVITDCSARTGGAIDGYGTSERGYVQMDHGMVRANHADEDGGAVYLENCNFTMNGGVIGTNTADRAWAGVAVGDDSVFTMQGGFIAGNKVGENRSGVGCVSGEVVMNAGVVDVKPIPANVNPDGAGTFSEPLYFGNDELGVYRIALGVQPGRQLSEITMRSEILSLDATDPELRLQEARYKILVGDERSVTGYYSFRPGEDLESVLQSALGFSVSAFTERVTGSGCMAYNTILETPGAPGYHPCVIDADATPTIYTQNDSSLEGFNPNDEHAFVKAGAGGYVVWALRADLNTESTPNPAVLVEYEKDGEMKMQFLHVVVTNQTWPALAADCTVAQMLPGPQPITTMDDPWLAEDFWDADPERMQYPGAAYRDRKGQIWARCAGTIPIYMYYRMQEGFYFPQYGADAQPAAGTAIPWLALVDNPKVDPLSGAPAKWTWTAKWPENYNEMEIGQTLYVASDGLPGVYNMKSASVIYPTSLEESGPTATAVLIDPTAQVSVPFDYTYLAKLGLSTDPNGGLNLRKGKYYFNELPPNLSSRVWVDSTNNKLCLIGKYEEKKAGTSVLYVNVLTSYEHEQLLNLVQTSKQVGGDKYWEAWKAAVAALGAERVEPNVMTVSANELKTTYQARDSYALAAVGNTNWVVLIENDAPTTNTPVVVNGVSSTVNMGVTEGDSINMHVFKVVPEYYKGPIVTREDEQNLLSQRLSILYTESFGGESDKYEFQWKSASPNADGTIPEDYDNGYTLRAPSAWADAATPHITVGEQGDTLANMVNKYWICRYRAKDDTCSAWNVMSNRWSEWCAPAALAEGWVQRVLNNVTPFNQLMTDLYENEAETAISMLAKAGKPYTGDVALNQDALTSCGLIELYETLFNKAESMSLLLMVKDTDANKQLQLCAERLGDLYTVLGDEAYSDAKNPTIGFGSNIASVENQPNVDFGAASSALFCFDNQVSSLLDEELALLRGRTAESAPYVTITNNNRRVMNKSPYYNRLLWNFTKGITAGEVAYAVNYNIEGTDTTALSEEQAAALYPQGHGDAYGHYLSALKGWYRLMRNPYFNWVRAQGEINIADSSVNVDYYEEAKFSEAALKVAKVAADVVDLTARKAYDDDGVKLAGYEDEDTTRAFGYGEWANRGAYGALVNWAVANSLLPADESACTTQVVDGVTMTFADAGLTRIDRGTVDELAEICTQAAAIQSAEDRIDAGLNPLGLSEGAIPFDISPIGANDGTKTHYEQIRERAGTALANAKAVLDRAQEYSNRLRMIQESADDYEDQIEEEEAAYTQELIGYYGTPYSDDIGAGKTYEQGYEGPDTVHYMWMDLSKFGLQSLNQNTYTVKLWMNAYSYTDFSALLDYYDDGEPKSVAISLDLTALGVVAKPDNITGMRNRQGTIQEKYSDFLTAYKEYSTAIVAYENAIKSLNAKTTPLGSLLGLKETMQAVNQILQTVGIVINVKQKSNKIASAAGEISLNQKEGGDVVEVKSSDMLTVVGVANGSNAKAVANEVKGVADKAQIAAICAALQISKSKEASDEAVMNIIKDAVSIANSAISEWELDWNYTEQLRTLITQVNSSALSVNSKAYAVNVAVENYRSEVAKAEAVLEKRNAVRKKWVNKIAQYRYNDMFFRQLRSQALSRYTAAFDLAQKYTWETAKAYGYETGLLDDDEGSGASFLNRIIASRSLGSFDDDGNPMVGDVGDTGLAGLVAQMDANWLVLKPRLGINNPQEYATWFSLRGECFRILPGEEGDAAWAKELTKYWVDDIASDPDFIRHCQPFQSQYGLNDKEPGLIIPFETTIDFAKNFFGKDLAGEDNAYDSTWYATRIYSAGVWFDGYNAKANGYAGKAQLANTPVAYLVPMGVDCMRVPGLEDGSVLGFNVIDQVIAAPYSIGSTHLNDTSWFPSASQGDLGGADSTTRIRKHPSFRAYFDTDGGDPSDYELDCTRLVGRSAWNTKWMLVIPAGSMNADRDKALSIFINGSDVNRDGTLDLKPVGDIRIGFKTYSNSGN